MSKGLERKYEVCQGRTNASRIVFTCESNALLIGCVSLVRWDGSGMTKSGQDFSEEARKFGAQSPHLDPQV